MTQKAKLNLELTGIVIGFFGGIGGICGLIGAFYTFPLRMEAAEKKIQAVETKMDLIHLRSQEDHELLTRIEERLIALQNEVRRWTK